MQHLPITAVILTKNEQQMIVNCIEALQWCQEVIVIDSQSIDSTVQLAKRAGAIVYSTDKDSFAQRRNYGLSKVRTAWVLYIDCDERISPQLFQELAGYIQDEKIAAVSFNRKNIHYGRYMEHGGWENDLVTRLFKTEKLKGWKGKIHESPTFTGEVIQANNQLIHLTHRNMVDGLLKSAEWTGLEAQLMFEAGSPSVTTITLLRKTIMEFFRRAIIWQGYRDGIEGWIEAMVQAMNRFIVYEQLWELQRKPSLDAEYRKIDNSIIKSWENQHP